MRAALAPVAAILAACAPPAHGQSAPPFDLLIAGGRVVDGSGAPARRADVGVRGGRVVAIGALGSRPALRTIDATDRVVAPGFVDVHAHADRVARRRPAADNFVRMGVTTIVTGNCGRSELDLAAHLEAVERAGISVNYASLVGHGTVREAVLGTAARAPTAAELGRMVELVEAAMCAGAVGMSTGLIYVPGTYADTDEIVALARAVAAAGGVYATHVRNEADRVCDAIDEALAIGRRAGLPVHLSHLKASGRSNWGRGAEVAARLRAARAAGLAVTGDQYAYDASSTGLEVLFPAAALAAGQRMFAARLAEDPAFADEMRAALRATIAASGFGDLSYCRVASAPGHPELAGLRLDAVAERLVGRADPEAQIDAVLRLTIAAGGRRVGMIYHKMAEADVETLLREPYVAIASDAGIVARTTVDKPHPRGCGNNPRVLGRYVRERGVLALPLAIHKMTALPARTFGLCDRGEIRVGAWADLVVFDAAAIADRATYDDPTAAPAGIEAVVVNGVTVVAGGEHTGLRPGAVLRGPGAEDPR